MNWGSANTSGSVALYHMIGITPEAPDMKAPRRQRQERIVIT